MIRPVVTYNLAPLVNISKTKIQEKLILTHIFEIIQLLLNEFLGD